MAVDYAALAAIAESLIESAGRSVTIRKRDRSPSDAAKPWRGTSVNVDTSTVIAAVVPFDSRDVDGEVIRRDDMQAYIAATSDNVDGEDLEDYDELLDGTTLYKIMDVRLYQPATQRLLYVLQLRR